MRVIHRIVCVALCVLPLGAHAGTWDILEGDLSSLEAQQKQDAVDVQFVLGEEQRGAGEELFPMGSGEAQPEPSPIDEKIQERAGAFLTVLIGGRTLIFHDVPRQEWFAPYVRYAAEQGLVSGYKDAFGQPTGEYKPSGNVSIEEVAKVAVMLSGGVGTDCPASSKNLTASGSWSAGYVACAEQREWIVYSDGGVDVKRFATRAEVVVTLLQALRVTLAQAMGGSFTDVPSSLQFAAAIERAKMDGIVNGYVDAEGTPLGTFGPDDPVTRAEFAKIVALAAQQHGMKKP